MFINIITRLKKKILFVTVLLSVGMLFGCSSSNETEHLEETTENSVEEPTEDIERIASVLDEEILRDARADEVSNAWNTLAYSNIIAYCEKLKEIQTDNKYVELIVNECQPMFEEETTDFEKDFLTYYLQFRYRNDACDYDKISKIWKIGYDENNMLILGEEGKLYRRIIGQRNDNSFYHLNIFHFVFYDELHDVHHDTISYNFGELKSALGIDVNTDSGNYYYEDGDEELNGLPYELVNESEVMSIVEKYGILISYLDCYYEEIFLVNEQEKHDAYEAKKAEQEAEPAVGMTKQQVLNGAWGAPKKKNIHEYEWGTEEQWVYSNGRYVYFENGIVTSVTHH